MESSFKKNIIKGFLWSFLGQGGSLITGLIVNVVLARLLSPYEFGQIGIIMFFIVISKVLTESGLSGALVRKKEVSDKDYSTVFIFNLVVSLSLMLILILSADFIARFYNDPDLRNILIVSSSVLIINAFQITQNAKLIKGLKFKRKASFEFLAIFASAIIGITLACLNAGVWAIVTMQITTSITLTALLWFFEGPLKVFVFSKKSFKNLYKFGMNTTFASLIDTAFSNIYNLILGKYFSIYQTGLFFQARRLQDVPIGVIKSSTFSIVFSALSAVQDNSIHFTKLYNRIITLFTVLVGLICTLVFFYSENIILMLYGEKWIEAAFYLQVLITASFFYMQEMFNRLIFKVYDQTHKILHLEFLKKSIQIITIIIGVVLIDIKILLIGFLITSILSFIINYYVSRKVQNNFIWYEFFLVCKVIAISVLTVVLGVYIENVLGLIGYYSFCLLPFLVFSFFLFIRISKVSDIIKDLRIVINTITYDKKSN